MFDSAVITSSLIKGDFKGKIICSQVIIFINDSKERVLHNIEMNLSSSCHQIKREIYFITLPHFAALPHH